ncbi:hypothetical protein [Lactococcus allomyrinae]|uniref:Uncharacterized protein n=1 Tax=Lactococcus allomyrinae TaxID=2419773 RepID=A0A387BDT7_9LACT|nr:hypothetical protein [Lactococcus allomyrinae]AYF99828.1 hypothetical protein D7I46_01245 [Lactococcus allomyrinae]
MGITLYLEANFITNKSQNPFFSKIINSAGNLLYVASSYLQGTDAFLEGKLKASQQFIQTPEEKLDESIAGGIIEENCTMFIDDALGDLKKSTLTKLLNSNVRAIFILARFEDWLHGPENKYTLSNGFDSFLISRPVITNPQRLLEFVNIFPEAEEKVLDWVEHPRKLPVNSYYVFNKQQFKGVDYFSIFDPRTVSFISLEESKQMLARDDKSQLYFNTLAKRLKELTTLVTTQGENLNHLKQELAGLTQKEKDTTELKEKVSEALTENFQPLHNELLELIQKSATNQENAEKLLQKLIEHQHIELEEKKTITNNVKQTSLEELFS